MPSIHTSVLDMACMASHGGPELTRVGAASARDRLKLLKYGPLDPARFHFTKLLVTMFEYFDRDCWPAVAAPSCSLG